MYVEPSGSGVYSAWEDDGRRGCGLAAVGVATLLPFVTFLL